MAARAPWVLVVSVVAASCAGRAPATFRATDPAFVASAAASDPAVYLEADDVPRIALRSVGLIEASGQDARARVIAKARELGCWAVVAHHAYEHLTPSARRAPASGNADDVFLVGHGAPHGIATARTPVPSVFDCVMKIESSSAVTRPVTM